MLGSPNFFFNFLCWKRQSEMLINNVLHSVNAESDVQSSPGV